jgi:thiamine biosynthesis lipoprotein
VSDLRHAEHVMGTVVSFDVRSGPLDELAARRALRRACATLQRADAVFSTWKSDSPLSRLRRGEITTAEGPPEMAEVLERCSYARDVSGGWFDPWAMPGGVDPTGLVKGWAAQKALADLESAGVEAAMVNAGGDVVVSGEPEPGRPWRIGIRHPLDGSRCLCVVTTTGAVATSGTYERGPHVLDPHTRRPAAAAISATVVGSDLALADALATGLLAAGDAGLAHVARLPGYSAMVVASDGHPVHTDEFPLAV